MDYTQAICSGHFLPVMDTLIIFFTSSFALHLEVLRAAYSGWIILYTLLKVVLNPLKILPSSFSFQNKVTFSLLLQNSSFDAYVTGLRFNYSREAKYLKLGNQTVTLLL